MHWVLLFYTQDHLPEYIKGKPESIELPSKMQLPALPEWETLFLGGGKKDKINKVDIVGFLSQKGGLQKDELGLIEIKDMNAYAAVKRNKIKEVIKLVVNEKIKGKKVKIEIARDTPKFEG
jgi:ATP-dependent RNA helicase DeaD